MTSLSTYSRINFSESQSDINIFINEFRNRTMKIYQNKEDPEKQIFMSFAHYAATDKTDSAWLKKNHERFFEYTSNEELIRLHYLSEMGYITCLTYSFDGTYVIVGHSTGLIQSNNMDAVDDIISKYSNSINLYYDSYKIKSKDVWYPMFYNVKIDEESKRMWASGNSKIFIKDTPNKILFNRWFFSESGFITCLAYSPNGLFIIAGYSTGLIQMRHGFTGVVLSTLRNIQFPPKPVYAVQFSDHEERVCYAACMDGAVYRVEIPNICIPNEEVSKFCIRADPALESLSMQFYGAPGISSYASPYITQRPAALSLGIIEDQKKLVVGYADTSIKIYDMETQESVLTYKVHKLRLQFIPKKLQRIHFGQVCAIKCHSEKPYMFASGAWDNTLRIWDIRCKVGCVMTFEGVNICSDSIDINRDHCLAGSWQPTEALGVWDMVARKRLNIIRVQNRRPDVDGEYIYACRYWRSSKYNRKGKYAIIGGSGTKCVEVINLHNRYITCSYPAVGTVLAVTSFEERIAFGGTAPIFNIVSFHDPKHEKYAKPVNNLHDYANEVTLFQDSDAISFYSTDDEMKRTPSPAK